MGREATCHVQWGAESDSCKVLLESSELILRGALRRRVPLSSLDAVAAVADKLTFRAGQDNVSLHLGPEVAARWAKAIATPPPSLAAKLGISEKTHLRLLGTFDDPDLHAALQCAASLDSARPVLLLAAVKTPADLEDAISHLSGAPIWIVYEKGPGKKLSESSVRDALRQAAYIDTKVASVSPRLTALRFQKRSS